MKIYKVFVVLGIIVRTQLLPDLISIELINLSSLDTLLIGLFSILFFTIFIEYVLIKVTFFTVGLYYQPSSFPAWGAILYTFYYSVSFVMLYIYLAHSKIVGTLMLMGYVSLHVIKLNKHP